MLFWFCQIVNCSRTWTFSCHCKCHSARLSDSQLNGIRWWPTGVFNLISSRRRGISGLLIQYKEMLFKAYFLRIVCINEPVFDCRLAVWKAWERAKRSNRREVKGWGWVIRIQSDVWLWQRNAQRLIAQRYWLWKRTFFERIQKDKGTNLIGIDGTESLLCKNRRQVENTEDG